MTGLDPDQPHHNQPQHNRPRPRGKGADRSGQHRDEIDKAQYDFEDARDRIATIFDASLGHRNLTSVPDSASRIWASEWLETLHDVVLNEAENERPGVKSSCRMRLLKLAQDESAYFALVGIEDRFAPRAFVVGESDRLIKLAPGAYAAELIAIPKRLSIEELQRQKFLDEDDQEWFMRLFIDKAALDIEAARFRQGDSSGLFGDSLSSLEPESEGAFASEALEVFSGRPSSNAGIAFGFICRREDAPAKIFEVSLDSYSNFVSFGLACFNVSDPGEVALFGGESAQMQESWECGAEESLPRKPLCERLAALKYCAVTPQPNGAILNHTRHFSEDLRAAFHLWTPEHPWRIEVLGYFAEPNNPEGTLLIQASVRDPSGTYHIPFLEGSESIRSEEPISLFFESRLIQTGPAQTNHAYRLKMLDLPPSLSIEALITATGPKLSQSFLGNHIRGALRSALDDLTLRFIGSPSACSLLAPFEADEDTEDESSASPQTGARLICFSNRGAHVVRLGPSSEGLLDLSRQTIPLYFFPEVPPFE